MNQPFNFDKYEPPKLDEAILKKEIEQRKFRKHVILLRFSSVLATICLVLFAFLIARDTIIIASLLVILAGASLSANILLSLVLQTDKI